MGRDKIYISIHVESKSPVRHSINQKNTCIYWYCIYYYILCLSLFFLHYRERGKTDREIERSFLKFHLPRVLFPPQLLMPWWDFWASHVTLLYQPISIMGGRLLRSPGNVCVLFQSFHVPTGRESSEVMGEGAGRWEMRRCTKMRRWGESH